MQKCYKPVYFFWVHRKSIVHLNKNFNANVFITGKCFFLGGGGQKGIDTYIA